MKDDYLWDGSGEPDPEIQRLEQVLSRLRSRRPAPEFPANVVSFPAPRPRLWWPKFALATAAALVIIAGGAWLVSREIRPAWEVASLEGQPKVGSGRIGEMGRLAVGEWLVTDSKSRARVSVGSIGQVQVEPNTRLRLIRTRLTEHRIALERGTIHATIWAPPRLFYVNTPSAEVVDLGCAYTLEVDDNGNGMVKVAVGWVAFEAGGRESFIPAQAACSTRKDTGPGTPYYLDASDAFIAAVQSFDAGRGGVDTMLREARKRDALSLWHLLSRVPDADRARVYDRLEALVPAPEGVTREGILRLDPKTLDLYWDALGLGDTSWWRLWKQNWKK